MHTDLPAQAVAAIATVIAALIAGAISFVNLTLNKEQKTSEFRQAWIDGLREDLATLFAGARAFARTIEELHVLGPEYKEKSVLSISDQKISDIRYQTAETHYRIKLRLNLKETEHQELLRLIQRAIDEQNLMLTTGADVSKTLKAIEAAADYAPQILKAEWERVKRGELAFRIARNWIAPLIVILDLLFVVSLLTGKMKI